MLKGRSFGLQITCVFPNRDDVGWEGQFLLARGSGPEASLLMRWSSHPDFRQFTKPDSWGKPGLEGSYQEVTR